MRIEGEEVKLHAFLTSTLVRGKCGQLHATNRAPSIHWIGSWVEPRADMGIEAKRKTLSLPGFEVW
jgi:hypothetical protein